jgi:hypothetical protein
MQVPGNVDLTNPQKNPSMTYDSQFLPGTIPVAGSVSSPYDIGGWVNISALVVPNGTILGGTVFAIWGAQAQMGPYYPLYGTTNVATTITIGSTGNQIIGPITPIVPVRFIELIAPGTQSAAQTINLLVK